jgi:N-acylglucosamine-6-phosphate 2-epimerase
MEGTAVLRRGVVVSCQALLDEPLFGADLMAAIARAAMAGGAIAIRANGPLDIRAIKQAVDLPVIGLFKDDLPGLGMRITPTREHARAVAAAGADIVAIDATARSRPADEELECLFRTIHDELRLPIFADVSTLAEGRRAAELGATFVATTLAGYTDETAHLVVPAFGLLGELIEELSIPVLAEGGISSPEEVRRAFHVGAYGVVVGSAITRPQYITKQFVAAAASALAVSLSGIEAGKRLARESP